MRAAQLALEAGNVTLVLPFVPKAGEQEILEAFRKVAAKHPRIEPYEVIVDACAMNMVKNANKLDVIVTENLYGDILSDLGAGLVGGLGIVPGAKPLRPALQYGGGLTQDELRHLFGTKRCIGEDWRDRRPADHGHGARTSPACGSRVKRAPGAGARAARRGTSRRRSRRETCK